MRTFQKKSLMIQMLAGQLLLILINGAILVATAFAISPTIFDRHLLDAGVSSLSARKHVIEAYISSFNVSLFIAAIISIFISGGLAWYFMLRIVKPINRVTGFAETLASGDLDAKAPSRNSSPELDRLTQALEGMSIDLAKSREEQSRILNDLAHELRTPIATVLAIVDGIEDNVVAPDEHTWQTIRDQLERVNRLSRDVREVSQNSEQVLNKITTQVSPEVIASSAFAAWAPRMEHKGISFTLDLEPPLPFILADMQRIGQVLSNLLENSLRYTEAGGSIQLSAKRFEDAISFTVKDSGQGIQAHQLPHIFDRLYRGDVARHSGDSGSGLGLTIARSIAENHGGTLTAASGGRNLGSTFTLTVPTAQV